MNGYHHMLRVDLAEVLERMISVNIVHSVNAH